MGILDNLFSKQIENAVRSQLSVLENENTFMVGARSASQTDRDRFSYDRTDILTQSLMAWRTNPLARRIIELTSQYVVGGGLSITCKNKPVAKFISSFWNHRLNHLPVRIYEMCDELTRTGNIFVLLSTDAAGMSYIRVIPTQNIDSITARSNDIEQPISFTIKPDLTSLEPEIYPAYDELTDDISKPVMLQYAINRPCGGQWGESDLAPMLKWLSRYSNWLEDRARLNRYRNAFLYIVSGKFASEAQRKARQQTLNSIPPEPGSILVTDENEAWNIISPRLESRDAGADGLAIKKMIAAGSGLPMHFLAEPESATRTTAEASGGPTYRHFEQRQEYVSWMILDILRVACARRSTLDNKIPRELPEIIVQMADISSRDNISLAMAASNIFNVLSGLRDRSLIDNSEFLRLIYRFCGESSDVEEMLAKAKAMQKEDQGIAPPKDPAPGGSSGGSGSGVANKKIISDGSNSPTKADKGTSGLTNP